MKLKKKPAVLKRLHLLVLYSNDFANRINQSRSVLIKEFPKMLAGQEMEKAAEKAIEYSGEICTEFCVAWDAEEKRLATECVYDFVMNGMLPHFQPKNGKPALNSLKWGMGFRGDELHIIIRSPITRQELLDRWELIDELQKGFVEGHGSKDAKELAAYFKRVKQAQMNVGKNKKETQEYRALREKRDELWDENEQLSERETERLAELRAKVESRTLFAKREKETLDEDILILRLARDYGKEAENKYYQVKLVAYLKKQGVHIADENASFRLLLSECCPEDWRFLLTREGGLDEIKRRTGAVRNFKRHLQEIRDDFSLSS